MTDLTAAYERLRAMIGTSGPPTSGRVDRRDFVRFALAADDPNPIRQDIAPPIFVSSVQEWGTGKPMAALRADGTGSERTGWLPLDGLRLMGGGQDLDLHEPVLDGTELTISCTLEDVSLKQGRSGAFLLLSLVTTYRKPDGTAVVTCRETPIARAA
ncbi:FAS1-like dehydratase domain-containing protein [Actinomadura macra]|uniref:FAS1-like dehydratase domain-containing protein n=1 Tax=Actinomadura macra TaxID=46164 RepID=UPI0008343AC0|nr:MaoC family dehydratase N-terminal domain-containing protein [Actinomadura macra]